VALAVNAADAVEGSSEAAHQPRQHLATILAEALLGRSRPPDSLFSRILVLRTRSRKLARLAGPGASTRKRLSVVPTLRESLRMMARPHPLATISA